MSVYLRQDDRPDCRFGFHAGLVWDPSSFELGGADPDGRATYLEMAMQEDIDAIGYGLPLTCVPGAITWIGPHEVTLAEAVARAPFGLLLPTSVPEHRRPRVIFEDRREFRPTAIVDAIYELTHGSLLWCQTEGLRQRLPSAEDWERREVDGWSLWFLKPTASLSFRWVESPTQTVGFSMPGAGQIYVQSDCLTLEEILRVARSTDWYENIANSGAGT